MVRSTRLRYIKRGLLALLVVAAVVSTARGIWNASRVSKDFQWSPTVLLLNGENPYEVYLEGDPDGSLIKTQNPNYAHAIYLILTPFGLMNWEVAKIAWAFFNVFVGLLIVLVLVRLFNLTTEQAVFVVLTFFASSPLRRGLGNGQHALIMLLALLVIPISSKYWSSFTAGFGYFKYSFAPPFAAYLLFKRGIFHFLASLVPGIVGFFVFWMITGGPFWETLIQPLLVASQNVESGAADIMTVTDKIIHQGGIVYFSGYYVLPVLISIYGAHFAANNIDKKSISFAFLCIISLASFNHGAYDFVFLLPVLIVAVKNVNRFISKYIISVVLFVWFGWKVIYELTSRLDSLEWLSVLMSPYLNLVLVLSTAVVLPFLSTATKSNGDSPTAAR